MISAQMIQYWFLQTVAMLLTALLIPRFRIHGPLAALFLVVVLTVVNSTVWDIALFLKIPDAVSTHALTIVIANGVIFWILVKLLPGIEVNGILPALAAPIVFSIVSIFTYRYGREIDWMKVFDQVVQAVSQIRDILMTEHPQPRKP